MAKMSKIASMCGFTPHSVRPDDYNRHDNCAGDCTTRALTYALAGKMTYHQVEDEQYRLAKIRHTVRNATGTYDIILLNEGWRWIQLSKPMSRGEIAVRLAKRIPDTTALTLSRTHIACVKGGKLIDTWDSRAGMVYGVMVPEKDINQAIWAIDLDSNKDIECKMVAKDEWPKMKVRRHRNRHIRVWTDED